MSTKYFTKTMMYVAFQNIINMEVVITAKSADLVNGTHPYADYNVLQTNDKTVYDAWEVYTPPVKVPFNCSTLMSWCIDVPLQSAEFLALPDSVRMLAISFTQTFAMNCNIDGLVLYKKSAGLCDIMAGGGSVCSTMAEQVATKARELNAQI